MELLNLDCQGHSLRLEGSMAGWQLLFWNNTPVSRRDAVEDFNGSSEHSFELQNEQGEAIPCRLETEIEWHPLQISYRFLIADQLVMDGGHGREQLEQQVPQAPIKQDKPKLSIIGLGALGLKLLKSAKVIKAVMAGASVAAYSWFFSLPFALALIFCLVIHEYGHIRAMKHFGLRTKGIYLIPFVGGLALSDERINTRWQDVTIALMGPFFGLGLSLLSLIAYWFTGSMFFAGLSAFNALLNLFNLLPVLPLDGGHILKSIAFSMHSLAGLILCGTAIAAGIWLSYTFGLALLGFLLLVGSIEIFFEWRGRHHSLLLPLDRYGQIFSAVWYLATVMGLVGIIWYFSGMGDALLGLPLQILQS
ncbi:site-2 protease family protein [Amphritea balenae]|uniref:Site-2 protease family protein n=1 Tax=Amphritea balenae TaxID=452629 RepID=A0A3P1SNY5_9GAMM|nr:site-2 protease family protein [Amphritea balenae]RRC97932.1 site-2 protease family protein [Amphritea balenae]GGK81886.1 Zn-dependent protease [Amphritea balenae]